MILYLRCIIFHQRHDLHHSWWARWHLMMSAAAKNWRIDSKCIKRQYPSSFLFYFDYKLVSTIDYYRDDDDDASSSHRTRWWFWWVYGIAGAMPGSSIDRSDQGLLIEPLVNPIGWLFAPYDVGRRHGFFFFSFVMHKMRPGKIAFSRRWRRSVISPLHCKLPSSIKRRSCLARGERSIAVSFARWGQVFAEKI